MFVSYANRPLSWTQPHLFQQDYQLADGESPLATLDFRNSFGSLATARHAKGCWTMKRLGFLRTRVEIRQCDSEAAVGTFHNSTWSGGGTLVLPDGRELPANSNFWHSRFQFTDSTDRALVRYTMGGVLRLNGEMEITPEGASMPEMAWIPMLGWYLVIMMRRDSAAASAAAT